ncbi:Acetyltransferase [Kitasatospora sp. MMS16-BH015]|uniref:GNAT family N-acetyltransferase n=1 Tax=Kitasatospora sp. MMS16-BH015 TaxID=2018025 RepID=UPI000CA096CE|nr:GNAT family protein [Kitasatospora sp. MMS16-BH015]AUG78404.1 Acetyltransferase [Kitasatospora sp. MMS16-BH015]
MSDDSNSPAGPPDSPAPEGFRLKPTLLGERVRLRPFVPADVAALAPAFQDRELLRLTGSTHGPDDPLPLQDPGQAEEFRVWRNAQPDRLDLAVVELATDRCVGEVVLNQWNEGNRSCNFRCLLTAEGRDRGLGTEAIRLLLDHAFTRVGLHRVSLTVLEFNPRARRVYEKVGFVAEGVLRDDLWYDGAWYDSTVMSVLAHEWPPAG